MKKFRIVRPIQWFPTFFYTTGPLGELSIRHGPPQLYTIFFSLNMNMNEDHIFIFFHASAIVGFVLLFPAPK